MSASFERLCRMRFGKSARRIVRTRTRRPRRTRCQTKKTVAISNAAASDVSEKCEPIENSRLPVCRKMNAMPGQKSNAVSCRNRSQCLIEE